MNDAFMPIRDQIVATAAEIKLWKRWHRTPPADRPPPPALPRSLHEDKRRATLLCMLRAHGRGRLHLRVWGPLAIADLAAQAAHLSQELDGMDQQRVQTPLLDEPLRALARGILSRTCQP